MRENTMYNFDIKKKSIDDVNFVKFDPKSELGWYQVGDIKDAYDKDLDILLDQFSYYALMTKEEADSLKSKDVMVIKMDYVRFSELDQMKLGADFRLNEKNEVIYVSHQEDYGSNDLYKLYEDELDIDGY